MRRDGVLLLEVVFVTAVLRAAGLGTAVFVTPVFCGEDFDGAAAVVFFCCALAPIAMLAMAQQQVANTDTRLILKRGARFGNRAPTLR